MGAHSIQTPSNGRRVAAAGMLAAGAAVAASGAATAAPVSIAVPAEFQFPGVPTHVTVDLPPGIQVPTGSTGTPQQFAGVAEHQPVAAPVVQVSTGQRILDAGATKIGSPYVWGAVGPNSFDCSGFTSWAHQQMGISIPRTSQAQVSAGTPIAKADLQPGDVVAFYSGASHVGIYAGNGQVLHAPSSGQTVTYAPLDSMPFYGASRYY